MTQTSELQPFIESVLMEYHPGKTIDEMLEYYGFKEIQPYKSMGILNVYTGTGSPTINSKKCPLSFFLYGGTANVFPCSKVDFYDASFSISTKLGFKLGDRTETVDLFLQVEEEDYFKIKGIYQYYTDSITADLLKDL